MIKYIFLFIILFMNLQGLCLHAQAQALPLKNTRFDYIQITPSIGTFAILGYSTVDGRFTDIFRAVYKLGGTVGLGIERPLRTRPWVISAQGGMLIHTAKILGSNGFYAAFYGKVGLFQDKKEKKYRYGVSPWVSWVAYEDYYGWKNPELDGLSKLWGGFSWHLSSWVSDNKKIFLEINHGFTILKSTDRFGVTGSYFSDNNYFPFWLGVGLRVYPKRWSN